MVDPAIATTPEGLMYVPSGDMMVTGSITPWLSGIGIFAVYQLKQWERY